MSSIMMLQCNRATFGNGLYVAHQNQEFIVWMRSSGYVRDEIEKVM